MRTQPHLLRAILLCALTGTVGLAQDGPQPERKAPPEPHFIVLRYPADRDAVVAVVGDRPYTLGDLVNHIEDRHYPGFAELLEKAPEFQRYLTSDLMAAWVRQFADIKALEFATAERGVDSKAIDETISKRLKQDFETYLASYLEHERQQGRNKELDQEQVNRLLVRFQLHRGLSIELQGWLDYLAPDDYTRDQLHKFYTANARAFGGQVTIQHILIQHRDAGTGILLKDEGRGRAAALIADIKARLAPDGSNFAELAMRYSHDTKTGREGGKITGLRRYDDRMPAELCRAAWALKDGEISDVVESRYGYHFIRRLEFQQNIFVIFHDDAIPSIRIVMQRAEQESLLFGSRKRANVQLRL